MYYSRVHGVTVERVALYHHCSQVEEEEMVVVLMLGRFRKVCKYSLWPDLSLGYY